MNKTDSIETVRKLGLNVMAQLAKLGTRLSRNVTGLDDPLTAQLGMLATLREPDNSTWELAAVLYNSADSANITGTTSVTLALQDVPVALSGTAADTYMAAWILDNVNGSAASVWEQFSKPTYPTPDQWQAMRNGMELPMLPGFPRPLAASVELDVPLPGVVALHACARPAAAPEAPLGLKVHVTTSHTPAEALVYWREASDARCIANYEVLYTPTVGGSLVPLDKLDTIFTAYLHAQQGSTAVGCYAVRARDYWGRTGAATPQVCV